VNPYAEDVPEDKYILAKVGAMLRNEELCYLRASVEQELQIKVLPTDGSSDGRPSQ
jgi:hypothetical protein